MRSLRIVLGAVFGAGVLLMGVGAGIAFGEYSSMEYIGEVPLEGGELVTETLRFEWDADQDGSIAFFSGWVPPTLVEVREDPDMPKGELACDVTYNEAMLGFPCLDMEEMEGGPDRILTLDFRYYGGNEFELMMENKDRMLQDIKDRKLASYTTEEITGVVIRVSPSEREKLEVWDAWN
ncbi:MAG: hypothetical protein Q4C65_14960 [Eubacteriales bacterium]|nr:hypothetical protein [Eubacteriales bacterium]